MYEKQPKLLQILFYHNRLVIWIQLQENFRDVEGQSLNEQQTLTLDWGHSGVRRFKSPKLLVSKFLPKKC